MVPCYTINKLRDNNLTYYHTNKQTKRKEVIIMITTTNKTTNIKEVIKEIKEYQSMQDELKKQINELKEEAIEWLDENELDEILTDEGKITYREVISKRFNSTAFKKDFADIYDEYTTKTSNMRFTCK
mgnify:CR=1 FL=1|jgi:predicted phage-related endonuclease